MIELKLPSLGEGVEKGTVVAILVKVGDRVVQEQPLLEVETDKVTAEVPSENEGVIKGILVSIGDEIPTGHPIIKIEISGDPVGLKDKNEGPAIPASIDVSPKENIQPTPSPTETQSNIKSSISIPSAGLNKGFRASPLARKVAREIGLDINNVKSALPNGRISVSDVKLHARNINKGGAPERKLTDAIVLPDFNRWGPIRREKMTGIQLATSKNMSISWSQIPHAWLQEKTDITDLEAMRQQNKSSIKEMGGSLTITCILVKALAKGLQKLPLFNTSIDPKTNEIIHKDYINIGVAVDTERGLVVPVIKNIEQKSLTDIAIELTLLSGKARAKKLTNEDLSGATFTISNLGGIGTTGIFPIVNFPQVAILGVAGSSIESAWRNDAFHPRLLMPMTIGFDHRVINGADAARFLKYIKELMENWMMWIV